MIHNTGWSIPSSIEGHNDIYENRIAPAASVQLSEEVIDKMTEMVMSEIKTLPFLTENEIDDVELCVRDEIVPHEIEIIRFPYNIPDCDSVNKAIEHFNDFRYISSTSHVSDWETEDSNVYHHICIGENIDTREDVGWWHRLIVNPIPKED